MLYKPPYGKSKDNMIYYHEGRFYQYSMFQKTVPGRQNCMWCCDSDDGVHWNDVGLIMEDMPFPIWSFKFYRVDDTFVMIMGSRTRTAGEVTEDEYGAINEIYSGKPAKEGDDFNDVLKIFTSKDLLNWNYLGYDKDIHAPINEETGEKTRLDCMSVIEKDGVYYGYGTGLYGFWKSHDGYNWGNYEYISNVLDASDAFKNITNLEVSDAFAFENRYYLFWGEAGNFNGGHGYNTWQMVSDSPEGKFYPDYPTYRFYGNSHRFQSYCARFCFAEDQLLVGSMMQEGYSYEQGKTYLPPLKKAVLDESGHLRPMYWEGNEALKGKRIDTPITYTDHCYATENKTTLTDEYAKVTDDVLKLHTKTWYFVLKNPPVMSVAMVDRKIDAGKGLIIEGNVLVKGESPSLLEGESPVLFGLILEEKECFGTAILFHSFLQTQIGTLDWSNGINFKMEDEFGFLGSAPLGGIVKKVPHTFRLILRRNMFEIYLDDHYVQTFNTTHEHGTPPDSIWNLTHNPDPDYDKKYDIHIGDFPRRLGFLCQYGTCFVSDLKLYEMNLD